MVHVYARPCIPNNYIYSNFKFCLFMTPLPPNTHTHPMVHSLCAPVCVCCVCLHHYNEILCIFDALEKRGMLTLVGEIRRYKNDRYFIYIYIYTDTRFCTATDAMQKAWPTEKGTGKLVHEETSEPSEEDD